ncbi:MAG: thioesterase [Coriobacteriales bacterium]|nr:thioesterase [Coriobacteriales bacterium]
MYSFSSTVRYSECDEHSNITIPALINYLQDCSTFSSESLGHGVSYLREHHFAWFIMAWQIKIDRLPRFCEHITVSTWCYGLTATSAKRNFTITGEDGTTLVRADSLWVVVNTDTGLPFRIPAGEEVYLTDDEPLDLPPTRRKLKLAGDGLPRESIVVTEQHLDSNHHVNNTQYIAMADRIVRAQDPDFNLDTLLVQYRNPAQLGDVLHPFLYVEDAGYAVDLCDADGSRYCAVRMCARQ